MPGIVALTDIAVVSTVHKTRNGHVLVKLRRTFGLETTAASMNRAIAENFGGKAGTVMAVGHMLEVEVVDIDVAATREAVLVALVREHRITACRRKLALAST